MDATQKKEVLKCRDGRFESVLDPVAVERRLRISVNGEEVLRLYCSPVMVKELVVGLFMTEGIIEGEWCTDTVSIVYGDEITADIKADGRVRAEGGSITSGCVGGVTFMDGYEAEPLTDSFKIDAAVLRDVFARFHSTSALYNDTGCVHSAALSDGRDIICFAEDIGRHNAVDKVIGYSILEGLRFQDKMMLASGRLSSEIITKCARWKVPLVASRTAPTSLAVEIAQKAGVTAVGFVRGKRFNVYSNPERVTL